MNCILFLAYVRRVRTLLLPFILLIHTAAFLLDFLVCQEEKITQTQNKLDLFQDMEAHNNHPRTAEKRASLLTNQKRLQEEIARLHTSLDELEAYMLSEANKSVWPLTSELRNEKKFDDEVEDCGNANYECKGENVTDIINFNTDEVEYENIGKQKSVINGSSKQNIEHDHEGGGYSDCPLGADVSFLGPAFRTAPPEVEVEVGVGVTAITLAPALEQPNTDLNTDPAVSLTGRFGGDGVESFAISAMTTLTTNISSSTTATIAITDAINTTNATSTPITATTTTTTTSDGTTAITTPTTDDTTAAITTTVVGISPNTDNSPTETNEPLISDHKELSPSHSLSQKSLPTDEECHVPSPTGTVVLRTVPEPSHSKSEQGNHTLTWPPKATRLSIKRKNGKL